MKILLVHNYYRGFGGENNVFEAERDLLIQQGHDVACFTRTNTDSVSTAQQIQAGLGYFYNFQSKVEFENLIKQFKPDIVHIHNLFPIISPSILDACVALHVPTVMTLHNYRLICPNALLLRNNKACEECVDKSFAYPAIQHNCYAESSLRSANLALANFVHAKSHVWQDKISAFITFSEFSKNLFLKSHLKLSPEQFYIKPNFVADLGYSSEKSDYFLYVGRLSEEKGIRCLLEAFSASNFLLKIIGDGPLKDLVIASSQQVSNILFLGPQPHENIYAEMKQAIALVLPSFCYEGCSLSMLEAFSTGTPVIASKHGTFPSFIKNEVNGLLFETASVESLLGQLDRLNDLSAQKILSDKARKTYEALYTPEASYQKLIQIYDEVICKKADT